MKSLALGGVLRASRLAYGCMPLGGAWDAAPVAEATVAKAVKAVRAAIDAGIDCFDPADIYCRAKSETVFARVRAELGVARDGLVLQSKCGIRFGGDPTPEATGRYDFSHDHIMASAEGTLKRLGTDRIDVYLLHRPDALVEPDEVARAFDELHRAGKVRWFGVSNHTAAQIELLRRSLRQPLVVNQVELSLVHSHLIDAGIVTNQRKHSYGTDGTLDYCRLNRITLQAWGPVAGGRAVGGTGDDARSIALATAVGKLAKAKGVSAEAIAVAWLLRHPAGIQPVIGTTDPARIAAIARADAVELTREEWYALHVAGRGENLP
jgi:predicted oxidoreductase